MEVLNIEVILIESLRGLRIAIKVVTYGHRLQNQYIIIRNFWCDDKLFTPTLQSIGGHW